MKKIFGFELGREFKLSIAEILAVFPEIEILYSEKGVFLGTGYSLNEVLEKSKRLGGTIKIFSCEISYNEKDIFEKIIENSQNIEGKFVYGLNLYGEKNISLEYFLKQTKNLFKKYKVSARYCNKNPQKNLSSAQILGNKILSKGKDYNIINLGEIFYFGETIWVQDIDAYSSRDYSKSRDMQIGMLPPKLSQIMINLSNGKKIYDPFVGLGTILIESAFMGNKEMYGSDLNEKMVGISFENVKKNLSKNQTVETTKLNAKFIGESPYLAKSDVIVTEGYLGEVMSEKNITFERIKKQRASLEKIYKSFFQSLYEKKYSGNIVISFPFWENRGKFFYFEEIYEILKEYTVICPLLPEDFIFEETKKGSLLYKRKNQFVGREIFKLKIKN